MASEGFYSPVEAEEARRIDIKMSICVARDKKMRVRAGCSLLEPFFPFQASSATDKFAGQKRKD